LLANTDNPCFKIETDAITDLNILDVVLDSGIQSTNQIKEIKMSVTNAQKYKHSEDVWKKTDYKGDKGMRTCLGERTPVSNMANDKIVATLDGNFVRMIDGRKSATIMIPKIRLQNQVWRVHARLRLTCSEYQY
jgi:hypothetical protein